MKSAIQPIWVFLLCFSLQDLPVTNSLQNSGIYKRNGLIATKIWLKNQDTPEIQTNPEKPQSLWTNLSQNLFFITLFTATLPNIPSISSFNSAPTSSLTLALSSSSSSSASSAYDSLPPSNFFAPAPVFAEFRASQKSTFFRCVPKFLTGRDYYRNDLKTAVEKEQWETITKFFELYPSKINRNDPNQIDAYDSYYNKNLIRPLKLLTSSFAEKGISTKQQALLTQEQQFEAAMAELEGCVKERKGEGLFAGTIPVPTGAERVAQAKRAYEAGNKALDEFVKVLNDGLMIEVKKVPL